MIGSRLVESAGSKDTELVQELAARIWREHYTPIIGSEQVEYMLARFQSAAAIAEQIREGYVYYLLLYRDLPAGYLAWVKQPDAEGLQLSKLYVSREMRGLGLGKAGLELVQRDCSRHGQDRIWLTVNKYNSSSISWYSRMGFEHAGSQVADIGEGFVMDDYILQKRISPGGSH